MTVRIAPTAPPVATRTPTTTAAPPSATSNTSNAAGTSGGGEPELRIYAPRRPFREVMRETRGETTARTTAPTASTGPRTSPPVGEPLRDAAVDLLHDVARGERFVRSVMRRAARGADFSPQELLAIQAGVYRYTQELELVSKIVNKGTAAVRQTLQSQS